MRRHWRHSLARILPRDCVLCGRHAGSRNLCRPCLADLPWLRRACERCAAPLPDIDGLMRCAGCDLRLGGIDRMIAAMVYEYPVDCLIAGAKFNGRTELARAAGDALLLALRACRPITRSWPAVILPVPLHPARLQSRGFNQAREIALPLARSLDLPLDDRLCRRRRDTPPQSGLSGRRRRRNLRNAFVAGPGLEDCHVAVVDDVVTTGSTVSAVAEALRAAGAAAVTVWAVARVAQTP